MRRLVAVLALVVVCTSCGGGDKNNSPTGPSPTTPPTSATRIIGVSGNLAFGEVEVGQSKTGTMTISNTGTAALNVSSLTVSGGLVSHSTASWTSGSIAAGSSQNVTIQFAPTAPGSYSGVVTVVADHTSGGNTLAISGTALDVSFEGAWSGTYTVERCDGTGSVQDLACSANRGLFPVGSVLPIRLDLNQSGSTVTGTVAFGQVRGVVSGAVSGGSLTLQGSGTNGQLTATISSWSTRAQGRAMTGNISYNLTLSGAPGTAVLVTRMSLNK